MGKFSRQEMRARIREKIARKEPIILGGAGIGLIAKVADQAGIDFILAYNTGPFRMDGWAAGAGYLAYGDCNAITERLGAQLIKVAPNTPVIAGVGAADPYRNIEYFVKSLIEQGFSGVTNVPSCTAYGPGDFRDNLEKTGLGYGCEVDMVAMCDRNDIFTVAYAHDEDNVRAMVQAGVDIVCPHCGGTSGGSVGAVRALTMEEACEKTQRMFELAKKENPEVFVCCHGGPFSSPEDVRICFEKTDVHGFIGASSIERLPVERAVFETVTQFKSLRLR